MAKDRVKILDERFLFVLSFARKQPPFGFVILIMKRKYVKFFLVYSSFYLSFSLEKANPAEDLYSSHGAILESSTMILIILNY